MTPTLSPEEVEALIVRGRRVSLYTGGGEDSDLPEELADALADLCRQLDEARAQADAQWQDLCHADEQNGKLVAAREAAERERDEARAECERQRERAEKSEAMT